MALPFVAHGFTPGGPSNEFPNPQGQYVGLIVPRGEFVAEQSGSFRMRISDFHDYSGTMYIGGYSTPLRGYFDDYGRSSVQIYRKEWDYCGCYYIWLHVWTIYLQLIAGTDELEGTVYYELSGWSSDLFGVRGRRNVDGPAPEAGRYTMRFPGSVDPSTAPSGDGYGALTVDKWGQIRLSGRLPDGVSFSRTAVVSTNGWWPLHVPLHGGYGALLGWMNFSPGLARDVAGDLFWVKPRREGAQYYPNGFSGTVNATGARYQKPPSTQTPLGWTNGIVFLSGGNLLSPATNSVTLLPGGRLISNGGDITGLTFSLNLGAGQFSGRFVHPATGKRVSYFGALDQLVGIGAGYFLATDQGGLFRLQPAP